MFRQLRQKHKNKGFTLVEMLLYISLVSVFITAAILFLWNIVYSGVKAKTLLDVNQNLRFASKRITYEIQNSSDIVYVNNGDLCLLSQDSTMNYVRIYLNSDQLRIAWNGAAGCTNMINNAPLTSNNIRVSDFQVFDLSDVSGTSKNVQFSLTVEGKGERQEWQLERSYTGSAELRI